ncbi:MAG: LptA/OstA family protein [Sporomusaceae bacterium]|nr:LptA/OstA family protein [Sporomusaceae bacterium]
MNKRIKTAGLIVLVLFSLSAGLQARAAEPFRLEADVIDYNAKTGQMTASGDSGVKMTQGTMTLTGAKADYNTKTQAGSISGSVKGIQDDMLLTAAQAETRDSRRITASGGVVLVKGSDRLSAPRIDYFSDQQLAVVESDAKLSTADAVITADRLETYFQENRTVAQGNVKIDSEQRNLKARADHAVYYGEKAGEQGKIVLTGNAFAVQDGNTIAGQTLTLYLADKAVDAAGRTKVIIAPPGK